MCIRDSIRDVQRSITKENESLEAKEKSVSQLILDNQVLQSEVDVHVTELDKYSKRLALLSPARERISLRLRIISEESTSKNKLAEKNMSRTHIVKSLDVANIELGHILSMLRGLEAKLELDIQHLAEMNQENERLSLELKECKLQIQEIYKKSQSLEAELKGLRDQEQQIIASSGSTYSVLQAVSYTHLTLPTILRV